MDLTISELGLQRGLGTRSAVADCLGIEQRFLDALDHGWGWLTRPSQENAAQRLRVTLSPFSNAYRHCQSLRDKWPMPPDLAEKQRKANYIYKTNRDDPDSYMLGRGLAPFVDHKVTGLALLIQEEVIGEGVVGRLPFADDGIDEFRVRGYRIEIAPATHAESAH